MPTSFANNQNLPRGLKDNNCGNIRPNDAYKWDGQIGVEGGYCVFVDIEHGIRALAKDIKTKITKDGLNTIFKYVPKFAPPGDGNNTQGYIDRVCKATGFAPDEVLTPDYYTLFKLVRAHISVEVGEHYAELVTDQMVRDGVSLAVG